MRYTTRVFQIAEARGIPSLRALARLTGLDVSTLSRVNRGEDEIGGEFIKRCLVAFPDLAFDDLFAVEECEPDRAEVA